MWHNSGIYSGLAVYELRNVLSELCTATNERQYAANRPLTAWGTYDGVTIPTYPVASDFTGLAVCYIGTVLGRIQYSLVARNKFYGYGGDIVPPFSDVGAIVPLINTYDYPSWQSAAYFNTRFVADEDGGLFDPLDIVASAGYGDDWLPVSRATAYGSQDLSDAAIGQVFTADPSTYDNIRHTNYRLYDQIRAVLEQLTCIQGKVWLSAVAFGARGTDSSSISQEDAYDKAVADIGNQIPGAGLISRFMQANVTNYGCSLKTLARVNMNFGLLKSGTIGKHEIYMIGYSGNSGVYLPNFTNVYEADAFTITDSDGDDWVCDRSGSGTEALTNEKAEAHWASTPHIIEFEDTPPASNPFDAIPLYPAGPPFGTNGARRVLGWDTTQTEHGLYTRKLSVGNGLTYG